VTTDEFFARPTVRTGEFSKGKRSREGAQSITRWGGMISSGRLSSLYYLASRDHRLFQTFSSSLSLTQSVHKRDARSLAAKGKKKKRGKEHCVVSESCQSRLGPPISRLCLHGIKGLGRRRKKLEFEVQSAKE